MENEQQKKFIKILEDEKCKLTDSKSSIENGCNTIQSVVSRFYGYGNIYDGNLKDIKGFSHFCHGSGASPFGHTLSSLKEQLIALIDSIIREINDLGLPHPIPQKGIVDKSINITNALSQTQSQTMEVKVILDALKDVLTGSQYQEIESILKEDDKSSLKQKLFTKLESFGESILASVIANIITNPSLWAK